MGAGSSARPDDPGLDFVVRAGTEVVEQPLPYLGGEQVVGRLRLLPAWRSRCAAVRLAIDQTSLEHNHAGNAYCLSEILLPLQGG